MKLLIIHLSDIHIKTSSDPVLARADKVVSAVQAVAVDIDLCLIITTGDIAHAGTEAQYVLAQIFLTTIRQGVAATLQQRNCAAPVHHVIVPGNHDCDLAGTGRVRDIVIKSVLKDPSQVNDTSVQSHCTEVQAAYFDFQSTAVDSPTATTTTSNFSSRLYYEYLFAVGTDSVRVQCCNTAWLSRNPEQQASLYFPAHAVPPRRADDHLAIAAFHHPYNWLEAEAHRAFRKAIESTADIVMTGHEHDPDAVSQSRARGSNNTYIEGGLLQDSKDPASSSFNILLCDTDRDRQQFMTFRWSEHLYVRDLGDPDSEDPEPQWTEFRANRLRVRGRFELADRWNAWITDPGVNVSHRAVAKVRLPDIFVFPDLRDAAIRAIGKSAPDVVPSDDVSNLVASSRGRMLITGDSQSGKTSLAKTMFAEFLDRGDVPVFLDGRKISFANTENLPGIVEDLFVSQYKNGTREEYRQLPLDRRVVIIDDFHAIVVSKARKQRGLNSLAAHCRLTLLIAHDVIGVENLAESDPDFATYRIQPFGHLRRNQLVEKWQMLGGDSDATTAAFVRTLVQVSRDIDSVIGKNFVPAYPPYVLAILQAAEAATPVDIKASTYGYYYELFIRLALAKGRTTVQFDIITAYLARLAFEVFESGTPVFSIAQLRGWHDKYTHLHALRLDFDDTREQLIEQGILHIEDDEASFKYAYVYYYFVAAFLHEHIAEQAARAKIVSLTESLHVEESANIMLFLAHLSRDPIVIGEMLKASRRCYEGIVPARIDEDTVFLDALQRLRATPSVFQDTGDHERARREELEAMDHGDKAAGPISGPPVDSVDPSNPIVRMGIAIKTLQILGQIVKNFPGKLEGDQKAEIVGECYELGLRALGWLYSVVGQSTEAIMREFVELIRKHRPNYDTARAVEVAQAGVAGLTFMASLGLVHRVAAAVGSSHLDETYQRVLDVSNPAKRLINLAIELDRSAAFPMAELRAMASAFENKIMAQWVLRWITIQHFKMFPEDRATKQRACKVLGIRYEQVSPQAKLLAK